MLEKKHARKTTKEVDLYKDSLAMAMDDYEEMKFKEVLDAKEKMRLEIAKQKKELQEKQKGLQKQQDEELDNLKDQEVIFYCRSGNRSGQACMFAETMGFTNVINLTGGMLNWREKYSV